jgi:putative DNA primase/helicase
VPTLEEVAAQWELVPGANVGIVLGRVSGLVGIDIDGPEGRRLLDEAADDGWPPDTITFITGRGWRLLYTLDPGLAVPSWSLRRGGGELKVLGEGALTVMPPSRHVTGKRYRWLPRRGLHQAGLAPAPAWVWNRQDEVGEGRRQPRRRLAPLTAGVPIPEGHRNDTLFRLACALRRHGATTAEVYEWLVVNNSRCRPPLDDAELAEIARSVSRYPPRGG